jgi:hypothetical protein
MITIRVLANDDERSSRCRRWSGLRGNLPKVYATPSLTWADIDDGRRADLNKRIPDRTSFPPGRYTSIASFFSRLSGAPSRSDNVSRKPEGLAVE